MNILISNQNNNNNKQKDVNRYSYSRFKTFHICPRKHHYQYVEQIETEDSETTIPGKLFHKCIEQYLNGEDMSNTFKEFKDLCISGKLNLEPDLLEYIVSKYLQYYYNDYESEQTIIVEKEYTESLEGEDYITLIVDQAFEKDNLITIRDIKTTLKKLKYTHEDIVHNQQLLLYVPYVENDLQTKVNMIQIDEVRMAKLTNIPINANGKPTADRRRLELVAYEDYLELLQTMDLDTEREYQPILEYLQKRGHPLFNRITVQILDAASTDANALDMLNTYTTIKKQLENPTNNSSYRIRGPLCNYCAYKQLCEYDMQGITQIERDMIIQQISHTKNF